MPNIVANVLTKQSSQATVQRVLYCFTYGGKDTSHVVARHLIKSVSVWRLRLIDCPNCHALSRKQKRHRNGP